MQFGQIVRDAVCDVLVLGRRSGFLQFFLFRCTQVTQDKKHASRRRGGICHRSGYKWTSTGPLLIEKNRREILEVMGQASSHDSCPRDIGPSVGQSVSEHTFSVGLPLRRAPYCAALVVSEIRNSCQGRKSMVTRFFCFFLCL